MLVTEAHAQFRNLLPELLDRRAELLRGTPKADERIERETPQALADLDAVRLLRF